MPYKDEDLNRSAFLCKSTTNPNPRKKRVQDSFFITKSPALALLQSNQNYKGYLKFYGITLSSSFFLGVTGLCSFKEGKWGDSYSCTVSCSRPVFSVHQCSFQLYAMYGSRLTRESLRPASSSVPGLSIWPGTQSSPLLRIPPLNHGLKAQLS